PCGASRGGEVSHVPLWSHVTAAQRKITVILPAITRQSYRDEKSYRDHCATRSGTAGAAGWNAAAVAVRRLELAASRCRGGRPRRAIAQGPHARSVSVMDDMTWLDATAQADLVRRGEVTPKELAEAAIARIEAVNPQLDAVIRTRFDAARQEADDDLPDGAFRGVPILFKDLGCTVAGEP